LHATARARIKITIAKRLNSPPVSTVFQWPGMGLLLVQSVSSADIPVMSAYLLLTALLFVLINLVVDLLYYAVDPRLRVHH
jgi:ABC-type dipeptide/oligopeptide/nickel transport system permease component